MGQPLEEGRVKQCAHFKYYIYCTISLSSFGFIILPVLYIDIGSFFLALCVYAYKIVYIIPPLVS